MENLYEKLSEKSKFIYDIMMKNNKSYTETYVEDFYKNFGIEKLNQSFEEMYKMLKNGHCS